MIVYTDSRIYAEKILGLRTKWAGTNPDMIDNPIASLCSGLLDSDKIYNSDIEFPGIWDYAFITDFAERSQYDILIEESSKTEFPGNIICLADKGREFHGYRNRYWESLGGNIHLSAYLAPNREIENLSLGFIMLSAVSVAEMINDFPGMEKNAGIKWVNDVLIEGNKVSGVLAQAKLMGNIVNAAILGIGVNVEMAPEVITDSYVPAAACINDFMKEKTNVSTSLRILLNKLEQNYQALLQNGYKNMLGKYRDMSVAPGKFASIYTDPSGGDRELIRSGIVDKIGYNLELYFAGDDKPVTDGRMILGK